ncbi:pyrroline-5-carboxylate reductase [Clostridium sp. HMP27]|uniref:pyrroline-5-carboxylate reductase n=1 Tax=Clostridium sp. HMP27 TaxID=1487921 RepID=UPI00052C954D|nr:pyrroline-5-carboxylate reductase [Clostridium sp. HMP27]KGK88886.1 pyrroline-5-carboxylate reductase [Clostridium sp. HMP27]
MNKSIGFIGCGNMGQAIIGGLVKSNIVENKKILVSNPTMPELEKVKSEHGVLITTNNRDVAELSDIIILAVKPNKHKEVIDEIKETVKKDAIIITIGAGISIDFLKESFNTVNKFVKVMPNTPALVGEGMAAICHDGSLTKEEEKEVSLIFESLGKVEWVEERLMDAVTSISGSSPAYVYMFIEALADGGVMQGLTRDKAYKMAAQAVLGSAKMVLETGEHPGQLKDKVCSPGGTTIEAVYSLEKNNFRGTIIEAVKVCGEKSKKMSGK